jgi:hypothetical protein
LYRFLSSPLSFHHEASLTVSVDVTSHFLRIRNNVTAQVRNNVTSVYIYVYTREILSLMVILGRGKLSEVLRVISWGINDTEK